MYTFGDRKLIIYNQFNNSVQLAFFKTTNISILFVNNNHLNLLIDKILEKRKSK